MKQAQVRSVLLGVILVFFHSTSLCSTILIDAGEAVVAGAAAALTAGVAALVHQVGKGVRTTQAPIFHPAPPSAPQAPQQARPQTRGPIVTPAYGHPHAPAQVTRPVVTPAYGQRGSVAPAINKAVPSAGGEIVTPATAAPVVQSAREESFLIPLNRSTQRQGPRRYTAGKNLTRKEPITAKRVPTDYKAGLLYREATSCGGGRVIDYLIENIAHEFLLDNARGIVMDKIHEIANNIDNRFTLLFDVAKQKVSKPILYYSFYLPNGILRSLHDRPVVQQTPALEATVEQEYQRSVLLNTLLVEEFSDDDYHLFREKLDAAILGNQTYQYVLSCLPAKEALTKVITQLRDEQAASANQQKRGSQVQRQFPAFLPEIAFEGLTTPATTRTVTGALAVLAKTYCCVHQPDDITKLEGCGTTRILKPTPLPPPCNFSKLHANHGLLGNTLLQQCNRSYKKCGMKQHKLAALLALHMSSYPVTQQLPDATRSLLQERAAEAGCEKELNLFIDQLGKTLDFANATKQAESVENIPQRRVYESVLSFYDMHCYNSYNIVKRYDCDKDPLWTTLSEQQKREVCACKAARDCINRELLLRRILVEHLATNLGISFAQCSDAVRTFLYAILPATAQEKFACLLGLSENREQASELYHAFYLPNGMLRLFAKHPFVANHTASDQRASQELNALIWYHGTTIESELLQTYAQKLTCSALPPKHYSEGQLIFVPADPKDLYDFIMYQEEEGVQQEEGQKTAKDEKAEQGMKEKKGNSEKKGKNVIPKDRLANHIFSDKEGKFIDTDANRKLIEELVNNEIYLLGTDNYGKEWFARILCDGTQMYAYVQNGVVKGAGINQKPLNIVASKNLEYLNENKK